jgi:hypothetical protein
MRVVIPASFITATGSGVGVKFGAGKSRGYCSSTMLTRLPGSEVFRIAVERGHLKAPRFIRGLGSLRLYATQSARHHDYRRCVGRFQECLDLDLD